VKFVERPLDLVAPGAVLAHTLRFGGGVVEKGTVLDASHLRSLAAHAVPTIVVAEPGPLLRLAPLRPRAAALVLAAGASRRMGARNKLVEPVEGVALVRRVVERVADAGYDPIVVVTGHEASAVRAALVGTPVRFAHNPEHAEGMGSSLAAGARALGDDQPVLVALGDMPDVPVAVLEQLLAALDEPGTSVVAPTFEGRRGHPVLFAAEHLDGLRACTGDRGARALLAAAGEVLRSLPVDDPGVVLDLDTPEALARRREGARRGA